ncbi:MAG: hypothetical protein OIF55_05125 [Amphritea sp.]|nr:hypothetical protein [Amphritea sp.]
MKNMRTFGFIGVLALSAFCATTFHVHAEPLDIPEPNSRRILQSGKILASWSAGQLPGVNFARLFYVAAGDQVYLCRVEERNRDIDVDCFARSTPTN